MATTAPPQITTTRRAHDAGKGPATTPLALAAFTVATLLIHGYHPFADDAGIYVAGIRKLVRPELFQPDSAFVVANTHLSIFAHLLAWVQRATHLPLEPLLFASYLGAIWLFLFACWSIARRVFARPEQRWYAVALAAACFTLPAAGNAIGIMDPYLTARSFSTPLGLLALAAAMDRRWWRVALLLACTGLMHPLMAIYSAAFVLLFALIQAARLRTACLLAVLGIGAFAVLYAATRHTPVLEVYRRVILSPERTFLFPTEWRWYEDVGLFAPLAMFALAAFRARSGSFARNLCLAAILLGSSTAVAAFLFLHPAGRYLIVRLQPLRSFHILYALGTALLGGWLGGVLWESPRRRWTACIPLLFAAAVLYGTQRATYPVTAHIEWPGAQPRNPWQQAYLWLRGHTPPDAVFAGNPTLAYESMVAAHGFRAVTSRSLLADDKDEGVAAVVDPGVAEEWQRQHDAQLGIDSMTDDQRRTRLQPFGVTWLLLSPGAVTGFPCPYRNAAVKICRMFP